MEIEKQKDYKCPSCKQDCNSYDLENRNIIYCDNEKCWDFITLEPKKCKNHNLKFARFYHSNKSVHLKKQCFECGELEGKYYKKSEVKNFGILPEVDLKLNKQFEAFDYEKYNDFLTKYQKKKKQIDNAKSLVNFLGEHSEYLKTKEWIDKRKLVLERDGFKCQACLQAKATQVHHKSYRYWKNEPLFDLESVCRKCYEMITKRNREVVFALTSLDHFPDVGKMVEIGSSPCSC